MLENTQLKEYVANIKKDTENISIVNDRNNIHETENILNENHKEWRMRTK